MPPVVIDSGTTLVDPGTTVVVDPGTTLVVPETVIAPPTAITPPTEINQVIPGNIVIYSPGTNDFHISYTLNGMAFSLSPGQMHTISNDRTWTMEYVGSESGGVSRYVLSPGLYKFKRQDGVVGLFATRELPGAEMVLPDQQQVPVPVPQPPSVLIPPARINTAAGIIPANGRISIFIRPETPIQMVYALNDQPFTMKPGYVQEFANDRKWNIQFLGNATGEISNFPLEDGVYEFAMGENGVELWVSEGLPRTQNTP